MSKTKNIRAIFIGCVDFSAELFSAFKEYPEISVVGVVSKSKSDFNSDFYSLLPIASQLQLPALDFSLTETKGHIVSWMRELKPDIVFCCGWSHLLDDEVLNIPRLGVVGYHPAQLPQNRGRHPIIWTLVLGLKEAGSTFFIMDAGADSGDIIDQAVISVAESDDATGLYNNLKSIAMVQFRRILSQLSSTNQLIRTPQDHKLATSWRKRSRKDGVIDWRMSAKSIYNLVRALTRPYPGAEFQLGDQVIRVWKVKVIENLNSSIEPGKILMSGNKNLIVKCGEDSVELLETDPFTLNKDQAYL